MSFLAETFIGYWRDEHASDPPWKWAICSHCQGHGTSTRYLGAYTEADRAEMGDEWYEFWDDVRAGHYDRACDECGGTGKVHEFAGDALDEWHEWLAEDAQDRATMRAESGYY